MDTLEDKHLELAKSFVSDMADYVNHNRSSEAFINAFFAEHRTLQQSMFSMMLRLIEAMADDDYKTDARNEDSKTIAKKLLIGFKEVKRQDYINEGCSPSQADQYVTGHYSKPSNYLRTI